jgi:hypothetical protein
VLDEGNQDTQQVIEGRKRHHLVAVAVFPYIADAADPLRAPDGVDGAGVAGCFPICLAQYLRVEWRKTSFVHEEVIRNALGREQSLSSPFCGGDLG